MTDHFNQTPRRNAEFIKPPNTLKNKVGSGGIGDDILNKAQNLLENNTMDFAPLAEMYLTSLTNAIEKGRSYIGFDGDHEVAIVSMLYPVMQLKANGGMFHFPLITMMADKLVQFLEVIAKIDDETIELLSAFVVTIRAILASRIMTVSDQRGYDLLVALDDACHRYFGKHPYNRGV